MPENTADFDIPKPIQGDTANLENSVGPAFDKIDELFGVVDLSQLAVPGSSDGKLIIVKDGAAAYKAMSGDGTIDEEGNFQLGSKVVGTTELGDKAVTTAKVDDKAMTLAKLAEALGLTEGYFADSAVTSRKAKLTMGQVKCSSSLTMGGALADVPGCSVTLNLPVKSNVFILASWLFELTAAGAGNGCSGCLHFDGADQQEAGQAPYVGDLNQRQLRTLPFVIPQEAGERTIKMRAQVFSSAEGKVLTGSGGATRMAYYVVAA